MWEYKRTAVRRISVKYFPRGVKFQWTAQAVTALKWPEITGCCSQTKTTDVPRQKNNNNKKKGLWLNCYSLSDHHNESTARRGSKRKSEEHPVIIPVCVCVCVQDPSYFISFLCASCGDCLGVTQPLSCVIFAGFVWENSTSHETGWISQAIRLRCRQKLSGKYSGDLNNLLPKCHKDSRKSRHEWFKLSDFTLL